MPDHFPILVLAALAILAIVWASLPKPPDNGPNGSGLAPV